MLVNIQIGISVNHKKIPYFLTVDNVLFLDVMNTHSHYSTLTHVNIFILFFKWL